MRDIGGLLPFPRPRRKVDAAGPVAIFCKACAKVVGVAERKGGKVDVHLVVPCHHDTRAWEVQIR